MIEFVHTLVSMKSEHSRDSKTVSFMFLFLELRISQKLIPSFEFDPETRFIISGYHMPRPVPL